MLQVPGGIHLGVTVQLATGMTEFTPIGHFKLISAENLPLLVRQVSLVADWYAWVFAGTQCDTARVDVKTNWRKHVKFEFNETNLLNNYALLCIQFSGFS